MVTDDFFEAGNLINPVELPPEHESSIEKWLDAIKHGQVGFLPRKTPQGLYWYAFAPTIREKKELLVLLDAWVGPTFSDLPRSRGRLYPADPFDALLLARQVPPLRFEVLPRGDRQSRDQIRNALLVLSRLVWNRPRSEFDAPRTTVEVLDDLGHAIAAQDRPIALRCLHELEATADLDQTNLAFMRFRVYEGLEDRPAIFADQDLEHVLLLRRPIGITRILQRAVYARYLEKVDLDGSAANLLEAAEAIPPSLRVLATGAINRTRPTVVVEFLLGLLTQATSATLDRLIQEAALLASPLDARLRSLLPPTSSQPEFLPDPEQELPSATTRVHALVNAGEFSAAIEESLAAESDVELAGLMLACARELEEPHLALRVAEHLSVSGLHDTLAQDGALVRSDLAWLDEFVSQQRTLGWLAWLTAVEADQALKITEADLNSTADWDLLDRSTVAQRLAEMSDEALARFGEHGGAFMAAHRALFAQADGADLCERVLAGLAFSEKSSAGVRVQTLTLLEYLAAAAPTVEILTSALEWTGMVVEASVSAVTASWVVDVLQTATSSPQALALDAKHQFFFRALEQLRPVKSALDLADLEGLRLVADELATSLPADFELEESEPDLAAQYRHLENMMVVLYSLTESAITRAAQLLRRLVPGIDVRTTSEHDGSQQLASWSSNADVFVMVAASAKHAATDFIKEHRGSRPLIQVNSRGSSSILRALAEG
ncbi:hypothetical protein EV650_5564 [Kribbella kalugense]|uniref:Uncharacterized protein n=1 Tax=Kribbella kalugense TaxID=2512221 RepID=A0A4R7ZQA4_9ACTN|nr:hypothetical protein EV650_5564 [Kribbella kalugense]